MTNKPLDISIRPACASDAEVAVPLIYSSGPLVWDCLMGDGVPESAVPYLHHAWRSGLGVAGYRAHYVVVSGGEVVAAVCVYSAKEHAKINQQTTVHLLRYFGWRLMFRLRRLLRVGKTLMPAPTSDVDYLCNFGVLAAVQGQGIGSEVLRHFYKAAKQRGKKYYELDVALNNPRGQILYERFGMKSVKESHDPYFDKWGVTALRRMQMQVL